MYNSSSLETSTGYVLGRGAHKRLRTNGAKNSVKSRRWKAELPLRLAIASAIFTQRSMMGLSQVELARKARLRQPRVSEIESLSGNPTLETLDSVARVLGLKLVMTTR